MKVDALFGLCASPDFARDQTVFAARASSLWRSSDGGRSWRDALESLPRAGPLPALSVALSPNYPEDDCIFIGTTDGIVISEDNGGYWKTVILPQPPPLVSSLVVSPGFLEDRVALAGTLEEGVYRTSDGGHRWVSANFGLLDLKVLCLVASPGFTRNEALFAGTSSGVFWSRNGGRAWRETGFPPELAPVHCMAIAGTHPLSEVVFAGTEMYGLLCSNDMGKTWRRLGFGALAPTISAVIATQGENGHLHVLVAAGDSLRISRDGGETWSAWPGADVFPGGLSAVCAPLGLGAGAPVLTGDGEGSIRVA